MTGFGGRPRAKKGGTWTEQRKIKSKEDRTSPDGIVHASRDEMVRWNQLRLLQAGGHIKDLERQIRFPLRIDDNRAVLTPTGRVAIYTPDFRYKRPIGGNEWVEVIEEHKGFMDPTSALRIAIFEAIYQVKVLIT